MKDNYYDIFQSMYDKYNHNDDIAWNIHLHNNQDYNQDSMYHCLLNMDVDIKIDYVNYPYNKHIYLEDYEEKQKLLRELGHSSDK